MADGFSFMTLYLWARKNPNLDVNFFDVFVFRSCFLAYFYLVLTILCGFTPVSQIVGCFVGHIYFFLEDVMPRIEETKGMRLLKTPEFLKNICHYLRMDEVIVDNFREHAEQFGGFA